jgi:hypothetical protein
MSFSIDVHHHFLPDVFWRATNVSIGAETDPRIGVQKGPLGWRRIEAAALALA